MAGMEPRPEDTPSLDGNTEAGQAQAPAQPSQSPSEMVTDINQKMLQMMDVLDRAKGQIDPQDSQNLATAIQSFQKFVEGISSQPGQASQGVPETGNRPVEAGVANVQPAL